MLFFAREEEFDIEITDEDFEKWAKVRDIVNYIELTLKNDK